LTKRESEARTLQNSALLTIDLQNDFVLPGTGCVAGTLECVPTVCRLIAAFRQYELPIVHVIRLYERDGSNAELSRQQFIREHGQLVAPDSPGARLVDAINPSDPYEIVSASLYAGNLQKIGDNEWLLYKPRWDAFFKTPLEGHLRSLKVETVVVCGCNFPNCPRATLFGASARDFKTVLAYDAISQTTPERLSDLTLIGTVLLSAEQVIEKINPRG
jgi:nicotinamidase-related amidase